MTSYQLTVEELEADSRTRAENMDLRHKDCKGPVDFKVMEDNSGEYWHLKCTRCHLKTVVRVGEDTKAIAMTAIDGKMRTLSAGQTVEQERRRRTYCGG